MVTPLALHHFTFSLPCDGQTLLLHFFSVKFSWIFLTALKPLNKIVHFIFLPYTKCVVPTSGLVTFFGFYYKYLEIVFRFHQKL